MANEKTSEYYREAALYWLRKMASDVKHGEWDTLKKHYQNFNEACTLAKNGRKAGD